MKKIIPLLVLGLIGIGLTLQARQQGNRGRRMDVEHRLSQMQKQLTLTSDQVEKLRPILQDQDRKMEEVRQKRQSEGSADRSSFMNDVRQIRQDSMKRIEGVLTPDQVTKFHQMQRSRGNFQGRPQK